MQIWIPFAASAGALLAIASFVGAGWDAPPVVSTQIGYRGTGMVLEQDLEKLEALKAANVVPEAPWEASPEGDKAGQLYENVQVLGDLSDDQFNQFMASITAWVAPPEQGCNYCHNPENMASDEVYQKVVARRMIQMNQTINVAWEPHVGQVGVTCYTCHRGQAVPANYWVDDQEPKPASNMSRAGQNVAGQYVGNTSLPQNALMDYLLKDKPIRVHSNTALPTGTNPAGVKETEGTWGLMMYMSESLGVNCVACHNSRAFNDWDQSPPQRVTAWHGIRMTRAINNDYMVGLTPVFPAHRKGPEGDVFKVGCSTCHNGVQKPLYGVSMLQSYVDALDKQGPTDVPDFSTYVPGETKVMGAPGRSSSLAPTTAPAVPLETTLAKASN
ncbi:photosynthetic reaction center cytochrome c subunit [Microvirga tunisiensis]|uniref:Photosynthetic reaction center cytochrome c subunit n=2 Tax=Pannonibacter tanglangensis TaxID=2750084 RepID=A0ABW9ZF99_9HYPH|nr:MULTISPECIES: photosynthetic reaction center cytochrome PufC [unclassified Pannonibacter]NBN63121.1 photosynthetic reaction center cytochrome c subunit [Pannonibacter sp. XCT-34]NBN76685.1 photosynthetic reaction center cytochrome c subunit [Pannonibacter sp. XCT-53]